MRSFLEEQVHHIFDRFEDEIDEISIIIPNKRAATYLQKYLGEKYNRPFFSPEILTINEWINNHTDEKIINSHELLFILHQVHQEIETNPEEFENFIQWGRTIAMDFDEIDRYLIDPSVVFKNLQHIKEIENWSFDTTELSQIQQSFKSLWDKLEEYYNKLELKLKAAGLTYAGKAYAKFYQRLDEIELNRHYFFLGFNAVSKVEKHIMKKLVDDKKATIVFDVDRFYYDNDKHEAGHFYQQIVKEWKIKPELGDFFSKNDKKIEIIETSQQIAQAKIAGNIISDLHNEGQDLSKTAIVLADESLLIPLSRSLPPTLETANITMGWPIRFSHLNGFLDIIFDLQFNFAKFKNERIYHRSLRALLQHTYMTYLIGEGQGKRELDNYIQQHNLIFMDREELFAQLPNLKKLERIFVRWSENNSDRLKNIEEITQVLFDQFKDDNLRQIDLEILYQFNTGLEKFTQIITKYDVTLSLKGFKQLFYQFWQNETLSFLGNPIDGLQVMGILETRSLDFENLIILGMNEGNLPKSNFVHSNIPRDLRRFENQLPVEEDRQAIFAHHFYRLLHRAKNIYLTYNSNAEGFVSGEKSRFITQIENELENHEIKHYTYSGTNNKSTTSEVCYLTNDQVRERLDKLLERGLSPSALNKLITCPLDFYYRYILRFDEKSDVEENIESSTFGTKIHQVLEDIINDNFKDGENFKPLTIDALQKEKKKVNDRLEAAYLSGENSKQFSKSELKYGQNKLSFDISKKFIESFIDQQIKELKSTTETITPIALEQNITAELELDINGVKKPIKLNGNADRIDRYGTNYRIIDYKSGSCNDDKVQLPKGDVMEEGKMRDFLRKDSKSYAKQLLMYALMFRETFPDKKPYLAGIISMVNIRSWIQSVKSAKVDELLTDEILDKFESEIIYLLEELYQDGFEFKHNPDSKYCQHCGS